LFYPHSLDLFNVFGGLLPPPEGLIGNKPASFSLSDGKVWPTGKIRHVFCRQAGSEAAKEKEIEGR